MRKIFLLILSTLTLAGCGTTKVVGNTDEIWFLYDDRDISGLFYCNANKNSDGNAKPKCVKAEIRQTRETK